MVRRFLLIIMLASGLWVTQAAETQTVSTPSGRLSLQIPANWGRYEDFGEQEIQGLDSETMILASHPAALNPSTFDFGMTMIYIGAYPYNVFSEGVLGDAVKMLSDVTVLESYEIQPKQFSNYAGAQFVYSEQDFFAIEALFDTGEMAYRAVVYSAHPDDFDLVYTILDTAIHKEIALETTLSPTLNSRTLTSADKRLSVAIPENWLFWLEGDTAFSFATSPAAYAAIGYAYNPADNDEAAFIVQRLVTSALRGDEFGADGRPDLDKVAARLRVDGGGLLKNTPTDLQTVEGVPMLDSTWAVQGSLGSVLTKTRLIDGGDAIYIIQAQYSAKQAAQVTPVVQAVFDSLTYQAPTRLVDATQTGLEVGLTAPNFTLPVLDQEDADLETYRGKVVLLNMWASWCGPCHREAPAMQNFYEDYGGAFEIVALNVGDPLGDVYGFVNSYDLTFPIFLDSDSRVAALYQLTAFPTTYIIGRDGVILEKIEGSFNEQGLRDLLAIYVGPKPTD